MKRNEALSFVASILAKDAASYVQAAEETPRLKKLAGEAIRHRREVAATLGIGATYEARLEQMLND